MSSETSIKETGRDRRALARDAGRGAISWVSVLAGVLVAFGATIILLALASALFAAIGVNTDLQPDDWRDLGAGGAGLIVAALLVSYLFGGYVAGRMARRAGLVNGLMVFIVALVIGVVIGLLVTRGVDSAQGSAALRNLRGLGIPTSGSQWGGIATAAAIGALAAMLLGSLLGGLLGDRFHTRLTRVAERSVADREAEESRQRDLAERERELEAERTALRDRERSGDTGTGAHRGAVRADDRALGRSDDGAGR
jgi:hypothetical protein